MRSNTNAIRRAGSLVGRALAVGLSLALAGGVGSDEAEASRSSLRSAQSWAYQPQGSPTALAGSAADVVVVDADHMRGAASRHARVWRRPVQNSLGKS